MTVTIEQIQDAIIKYIDREVGPKASGFTKFSVYFMAPSIPKIVKSKYDEFRESGFISDIIDENGNILLEEAYNRAKEAMSKSGKVLVPKINYYVDETDVDMLYNIIKGA